MPRTEDQIRGELGPAQEAYAKASQGPEREWRPLSDRLKALSRELSEAIALGAKDCPDGSRPHGMRNVRLDPQIGFYHVYVIGDLLTGKRSVGGTRQAAVDNWNKDIHYQGPSETPPSIPAGDRVLVQGQSKGVGPIPGSRP